MWEKQSIFLQACNQRETHFPILGCLILRINRKKEKAWVQKEMECQIENKICPVSLRIYKKSWELTSKNKIPIISTAQLA